MNILVLHGLGDDLTKARGTSVAHLRCFELAGPQHRFLYHDVARPVTADLREFPFDMVLIDGTFLCWRWVRPRQLLLDLQAEYAWLRDHPAVKIAFPQDDYDHAHVLDRWLADLRVDHVYTVCPRHHDVLYPELSRQPGRLSVALTGYVDDRLAELPRPPIASRPILVGYRARNLPPWFGRMGRAKAELGERFAVRALGRANGIDVSTDPANVLIGEAWTGFLRDSRFTLGCPSGSSILDPEGEIRDAAEAWLREHPQASFEEVEAAAFPGQDNRWVFSALSPRVFEAAALGSCQVLLEGEYLPEMRAGEHYIELLADWSNFDDVLDQLRDVDRAQTLADACFRAIVEPATYRYASRAGEVFARAEALRHSRTEAPGADFERMAQRHDAASLVLLQATAQLREATMQLAQREAELAHYRKLAGELQEAAARPLRQKVLSHLAREWRQRRGG